jgi:polysaccharide lyase-like protein
VKSYDPFEVALTVQTRVQAILSTISCPLKQTEWRSRSGLPGLLNVASHKEGLALPYLLRTAVMLLLAAALGASCTGASPPHPSADSGAVRFRGSFEDGGISPWGAQCANTSSLPMLFTRGTLTVQSNVVGEGAYAARIDLPAAPSDKTACEALSQRPIGFNSDDYYALMVRFPTDWREPSPAGWGAGIAHLNYEGIWGAPVSLNAHADTVALVVQSGLCRSVYTSSPGCTYSSGLGGNLPRAYAVPAPLALGIWHELIVHVRWAIDSSGEVEVWHRLKGSSAWEKTVSVTGYPTLQWTADTGPEAIASRGTVDKIGAYRGQADFPLTIWHDGFVRTTSFASAASALP